MKAKIRNKWQNSFYEWFRNIIGETEILDYRYPIKGFGVWMPYGFKVRKAVTQIIRNIHDSNDHEEALFPLLVPDYEFQKEAIHVKGFEDEVFWVTHGGLSPLDVKLALRPTSETAIYPMYKLWIRSHTDLPIRMYQIVSVFRHETKATKPMIRVREITTFKEAHTVHATIEDLEAQVKIAQTMYKDIFDTLGVPYLISRRPDWDKFAGAEYSDAFDCIMPDGKTLQIGTIHNLGQHFSKTFDITFEDPNGNTQLVFQSCYGISERSIAAVLSIHGDDNGLVLPPNIAPIQVIIIPILFKDTSQIVLEKCQEIADQLSLAGIRVQIDKSDQTPGNKYYKWEAKGVPVRLEIGPRDIKEQKVVSVRRDSFDKKTLPEQDIAATVNDLLEEIQIDLSEAAKKEFHNRFYIAGSIPEINEKMTKKNGITIIGWCGNMDCITKIEEQTQCTMLGNPLNYDGDINSAELEKCPACNSPKKEILAISRSY